MLKSIDQMFAAPTASSKRNRTWASIPAFLDAKVAAGGSRSVRDRTMSAVNALLKMKGLTPENAPLDLPWHDRTYPRGGWDPTTMSFEQATYERYRGDVRRVIADMTGTAATARALRAVEDDWTEACAVLAGLPRFANPSDRKRLIPLKHTLTNFARRAGIGPRELDQPRLKGFHDAGRQGEKGSLRRAAALLAELQATAPEIRAWFPHPIEPIEAKGAFVYDVPAQLQPEVEKFVEHASRKKYIRAKQRHVYVSNGTRVNFRTTMHAVVDGLIKTKRLRHDATAFAHVLKDSEALDDLLDHVSGRVEAGEIGARHATALMNGLPVILDRNGIDSAQLRASLKEIDELQHFAEKSGMPVAAMRLCRKLIEHRAFRNRFLLAHARSRQVAQSILDAADAAERRLTKTERLQVIRHGVVAAFCAIEVGGAPIRVENVLEASYGVEDAWVLRKDRGFLVVIPGAHVKTGREIRFEMQPDKHRWCDTLRWYLETIRPLILEDPDAPADDVEEEEARPRLRPSRWLIPMLSDPSRCCPYETFLGWFTKIMRNLGVPCLPHNYRHGQASILFHNHPHRIGWIAQRLGDTEETVLRCYAWVHKEKAMAEGQRLISDLVDR